jgi:hypothetical protein
MSSTSKAVELQRIRKTPPGLPSSANKVPVTKTQLAAKPLPGPPLSPNNNMSAPKAKLATPPPGPPPSANKAPTQALNFNTVSTSAGSLGFKINLGSNAYEADNTKKDEYLQENRIKFLQQMPERLKVIIDDLNEEPNFISEDTKSKIRRLRNEANDKIDIVWPRIKGSSGGEAPIQIGGKRTRRARIGSNKTKHRRRNQYKR